MVTPIGEKVQSTLDEYVTTKHEMRKGEGGNEIGKVQEAEKETNR